MTFFPIDKKITISVSRDASRESQSRTMLKKLGFLSSFSEDEIMKRRLQSKNGFKFYDAGLMLVGGVWTEVSFVINPPIMASPPAVGINYGDISQAALESKAATMLGFGVENFKDIFKPITRDGNADFYNLNVWSNAFDYYLTADSEVWSEDGTQVVIPEDELASSTRFYFANSPFNSFASVKGVLTYKITAEPFFEADVVPFTLRGDESFFLMPAVCLFDHSQSGAIPESIFGWLPNETEFYGGLKPPYFTFPRLSLSAETFSALQVENYGIIHTTLYPEEPNYVENYAAWYEFGQWLSALAYCRLLIQFTGKQEVEGAFNVQRLEEYAASSFPYRDELFPAPPALPDPYAGSHYGSGDFVTFGGSATNTGDLLCVIQRKDGAELKSFYVWQEGFG